MTPGEGQSRSMCSREKWYAIVVARVLAVLAVVVWVGSALDRMDLPTIWLELLGIVIAAAGAVCLNLLVYSYREYVRRSGGKSRGA